MNRGARVLVLFLLAAAGCAGGKDTGGPSAVLIDARFRDDSTFVIVCRGYPREGLSGIQAEATAREAALLNAQMIARDTFADSVDVVRGGAVEKYESGENFAVIHYSITSPGLKGRLRKKEPQ